MQFEKDFNKVQGIFGTETPSYSLAVKGPPLGLFSPCEDPFWYKHYQPFLEKMFWKHIR